MGVLMSDKNGNLKQYAGNKLPTGYAGLVTQVNNMKAEQDNKIEKVEVIYDKDSNDVNINLGYTSGIMGGTDVYLPENFSTKNYKRLEISFTLWNVPTGVVIIDLSNYYNENTRVMWSANSVENNNIVQYSFVCNYNRNTQKLSSAFWEGTNTKNNAAGFVILSIKAYK